jgi:hypothetical protein
MLMVCVIATTPMCTWKQMQTLNQSVATFSHVTCGRNQVHYCGALKRIVEGGLQCFFSPT